jgi:hypothetical protein
MTALVMLLAGLAQANGLATDSMQAESSQEDDASLGIPGDDSPEGLIVNGFESNSDDFPAVVALGYTFGGGFNEAFCSGTLINEYWVLTAAHCIDTNLNGERVYVGVDVSDYDQRVRIERWIKHPNYNAQQITNDVGLVELQDPITNIAPMPLNDTPVNNQWMDREHYFVGYGITNDNRNDAASSDGPPFPSSTSITRRSTRTTEPTGGSASPTTTGPPISAVVTRAARPSKASRATTLWSE